jgi:Zn-dependent peptidase ImmA (M78 family)
MNKRDAIMEGVLAAARLHKQFGSREHIELNGGGIDVFGGLLEQHAALLFRPLEGLLGFCIKGEDVPGVVISTQRPLRIQRFTGAHELGHVALGHTLSLDGDEILERGAASSNLLEVAADSFASEFLLPKWLLQYHASLQGWTRDSLADPACVYQLSLRCGASYHAMCVALARYKFIGVTGQAALTAVQPRTIKKHLLGGFEVDSYHRDVWVLTERDQGQRLEGEPTDVCVVRLPESGGAGYLWDSEQLTNSGFTILRDQRVIPSPREQIGQALRVLTAMHEEPAAGEMRLTEVRPWDPQGAPLARFTVSYDLFGKEVGMPRAVRRQLLGVG